jgi:hypothetical protein
MAELEKEWQARQEANAAKAAAAAAAADAKVANKNELHPPSELNSVPRQTISEQSSFLSQQQQQAEVSAHQTIYKHSEAARQTTT